MEASTQDDYVWLMSANATSVLQNATDAFRSQTNVVRLARTLRKEVSANRAALVMEQAQLRLRAITKFARAQEMFFTRRGLEQSTGAAIARYKAARFTECDRVADVCCGVGGDLIALDGRVAETGRSVMTVGIDADELTATFARRNLEVCGVNENTASVTHAMFEDDDVSDYNGLHFDPDRRGKATGNQRTVHGARFEPSLTSVFQRTSGAALVAVKVAPATPVTDDWPGGIEREWIGDRRECKQQVIWRGDESVLVDHRVATCVDDGGTVTRFRVSEAEAQIRMPTADAIGDFIYEPHPAVLAARLGHAIGQPFDLRRLAEDVAYMTGTQNPPTPLLRCFRVLEVLPLHLKKVTQELKRLDSGTLEVKRRGVEQPAGDAFMKLKFNGSRRLTVILTRLNERRIAIIATRVGS